MTSSSAGSTAFFAFAQLAICTLVILLVRYYLPLRTTPAYVLVPVFLAIALPASIVVLVPIDLASTAETDTDGSRGIWLSERIVYKWWRTSYWLTFALTWVILPYLGEYCDSGYREPKARLLYSLRSNARYQLITLGAAILGAVYIFLYNGMHWNSFKALVMALPYAWGLALAIYLMGHGLVALPRTLYRYANIGGRLKKLQSDAPKLHEKLTDTLDKLDQYESQAAQLKARKNGTARDYQEWIDELADMCSLPENRVSTGGRTAATVPPVITEKYLAELTRKLMRARHAKTRFSDEWDTLVRKAIKSQAILDSKASQRLEFTHPKSSTLGVPSRFNPLTPYTRYHLHVHVIPAFYYFSALISAIASLSIIWSECIRSPKLSLIGLTVVHHPPSSKMQIGFAGQIIAAAWLCYMCICAFFSLTEVKIWGNRALVKRNTYQESATWYGLQVAKLTVPLAYNFVTFTPRVIYVETSFHKFLGRLIVLTPLGEGFSDYFPVFILVPVLASAFGLYGRIKNICGFGDLLEDEEEDGAGNFAGTGSWREGRALIEREIQGASGNVLGLAQRGSSVSPPNGRYTDNPTRTIGGSHTRRSVPEEDRDEEGEGFFSNFGARVKNTFDTSDITVPKWLSGSEDRTPSSVRRSGAGAGGADRGTSWTNIFGGRAEEGRVRL
jgi:hypothetical protein